MESIRITGGNRLRGSVDISGSKNAALPVLASTVAVGHPCVIHNCPRIRDVDTALLILRHLGCRAERSGTTVTVDASQRTSATVPEDLSLEMRSSVLFLGALVGAGAEAVIHTPGGCVLGKRPIDLHICGLQKLGAAVTIEDGCIHCRTEQHRGGTVFLPYPSVGATENLMLAALGAEAPVQILGAAREPEIVDLAAFLNACGATILGAGTSTIRICGAPKTGAEYTVMPDRMEAVTYLSAAVSAGGAVTVNRVCPQQLTPVLRFFQAAGCEVWQQTDCVGISCERLHSGPPVLTGPYPAFPTDAQPTVMAAMLKADGTTVFAETVFENRYRHVPALCALGARIEVAGRIAAVRGVKTMHAADMTATDLRGGAAMLVAALGAEGSSRLDGLHHIDRGYALLTEKLRALGAQLERTSE